MWENWCSSSEGLLLLSSSKLWIYLWIPHKVIQLQREILAEIFVRLPHTITEKIPADSDTEWMASGRPYATLRSPYVGFASTSLGFASLSVLIDLLPGVSALSLPVSHLDSWLLKLTLLRKISDSLSPSALPLHGHSWPCANLCFWAIGSLSASLYWGFFDWENISLSECYPCPSTARNLLSPLSSRQGI